MAKELSNPYLWEIEFIVDEDDGTVSIGSDVYYHIVSEGITERRPCVLSFTPTQEAEIKQFAKDVVLPQIKAAEEI